MNVARLIEILKLMPGNAKVETWNPAKPGLQEARCVAHHRQDGVVALLPCTSDQAMGTHDVDSYDLKG